ncbi:MAG: FAD:protein FMN transferase [Coraliomargarita sp.]
MSGAAKGYVVDRGAQLLDSKSVQHYLINIGGEVRAKGQKGERLWTAGIEHPDSTESSLIDSIDLQNASLATSGNYRKFFKADGKHYSHVIDPRTGHPIPEDRVSVSVLADDCATADGLATAFLVLGVDQALKLSDLLDQVEVLFVTECSEGSLILHQSKGWPSAETTCKKESER